MTARPHRVPTARLLCLAVVAVVLAVLQAVPASAHVTLTLIRIPSDTAMQLAYRAPIEREGTTNKKIESLIPPQFTVTSCEELVGWTCEVEALGGQGTVITWEALTVGTPNDLRFEFDVVTPSEPGLYRMPTIQTYSDGHEAEWIAEDEPNPAPWVEVEHDIEPEEAPEPTQEPTTPAPRESDEEPSASSAPDQPGTTPTAEPSAEGTSSEATPTPSPSGDAGQHGAEDDSGGDEVAAPAESAPSQEQAPTEDGGGFPVIAVIGLLVVAGAGLAVGFSSMKRS